jgi:serine/threonine protein kinase
MPDVRIVAGKYRLVAKLSDSGVGAVWSAEHMELMCPAAVKLLSPAFAESPETLARFKREAQSAASLRSTNIVQILDFGVDDGEPYIAMELLRGQTLATRLSAERRLPPRETAIVLSQVARAVTWAHGMGIIHRNLKPGNIFLSEDAGKTVVKLLDFGIAKPMNFGLNDAPVTMTGTILGTSQYMSPEQASGKRTVDHRTDIWSFGIVAYECITGHRAFATDTLNDCNAPLPVPSLLGPVPKGFDEWFARCAHHDPERRFLSIAEAADILRFVCGLELNSTAGVPQLYSEPPPSPYVQRAAPLRPKVNGLTPGSTVAPSMLSMGDLTTRSGHFSKYLILGLLLASGAGLAVFINQRRGVFAPAAALSLTLPASSPDGPLKSDAGTQRAAACAASNAERVPQSMPFHAAAAGNTKSPLDAREPRLGGSSPETAAQGLPASTPTVESIIGRRRRP